MIGRAHHIRTGLRETEARGQAVRVEVRGPAAAAPRPLLTREARLEAPLSRLDALQAALCLARLVTVSTRPLLCGH